MSAKSINTQREEMRKTSKPDEVIAALEKVKCKECSGSGQCDDAECGDMYYNTWECEKCKGTGWNGKDLQL